MERRKPRVVVDTNVFVSSLWGGNPQKVVDLWKEGRFLLLISLPVLKEYLAVLARFGLSDQQLKERGCLFLESPFSILVHPSRHFTVIKEDPSDNMFLECAVEGKADHIVSGDAHLLGLGTFRKISIVPPGVFLQSFD